MKKIVIVHCIVLFSLIACSKKMDAPSGTAATVNGTSITHQELAEAAKSQLQRVETQIYQIKNDVLENLIEQKLIEAAAKKENMSVADFLKREVDDKITEPTEESLKTLYSAHQGANKEPFEKIKDQIANYVKNSQRSQHHQQLLTRLKTSADIKISLEPPRSQINIGNAPSVGPKDAKITLVEFSDYECPFCKRVQPALRRLRNEYGNDLKYVFIDFPLSFHQHAQKAHEAAYCAGEQEKYFEYNTKLFDNQQGLELADLKKYAEELQLKMNEFNTCLDSGKFSGRVQENLNKGIEAGVSGTPAFFINGIMLSGAQPYEQFKQIIESELKK